VRNPTLPRAPGDYRLALTAYSNTGCTTGTISPEADFRVLVTAPHENPSAPLPCGLRVALVLDESTSITNDQLDDVRTAARGFVTALSGTGASVAVIAFGQRARVGVPYTEVTGNGTSGTIASTFNPFINNSPASGNGYGNPPSGFSRSGTNWEEALRAATPPRSPFPTTPTTQRLPELPNLVVFVTDGDPNGNALSTSFTTDSDGGVDILRPAYDIANTMKTAGAKVFAMS
jgi:hypothetical protein